MMLKTSPAGRALIEKFEGRRLTAYRDVKGIPTIGIGHTGPEVKLGMVIDDDECDRLFQQDLERFEAAVNAVPRVKLRQHQFDACVSLAFNIGVNAFKNSTLAKHLSANDFARAADQFPRWCHSGSAVIPGLVRRRHAERDLFLGRGARAS